MYMKVRDSATKFCTKFGKHDAAMENQTISRCVVSFSMFPDHIPASNHPNHNAAQCLQSIISLQNAQ